MPPVGIGLGTPGGGRVQVTHTVPINKRTTSRVRVLHDSGSRRRLRAASARGNGPVARIDAAGSSRNGADTAVAHGG